METAPLKSFGTWARTELITQVSARIAAVLAPASPERTENPRAIRALETDILTAGADAKGKDAVADKVAYTWFNRIIALRFMDANGYTNAGVVSPAVGQTVGQPEVLADAKRGTFDPDVVNAKTAKDVTGLLDGTRSSSDPQGEAYTLLLAEYSRYWNKSMPFMFEREGDYTELLIPSNLLADESILARAVTTMTSAVCEDVEVIGWLYQFYISERKDEVFAGFKKNKKAGAAEIPAATQLFTPHWIVRYLVENSVGRLWMLNHPESRLVDQMDYYIAPVDEETDFLKLAGPEELTVIDPACGSGHMLTYAFDLLYAIYEEEGYSPSEIPGLILLHNLHGTEIDQRAGALAAFALTMKARGKQRTFFTKNIEPDICVIEPISFGPDEVDFLVPTGADQQAEEEFWNQFEHADVFGALIRPDSGMTKRLAQVLEDRDQAADLLAADVLARAQRVIKQAQYLANQYSVVVANPPYMGSKQMSALLSQFMKDEYPDLKSDLFAGFIERCTDLVQCDGQFGFMTPLVWMFIKSYEPLRKLLITKETITSLIQLEYSGFEGATVPICAFTIQHGARPGYRAGYVRLADFVGPRVQAPKALEAIRDQTKPWFYRTKATDFAAIPGSPIVYWFPEPLLSLFGKNRALGSVSHTRIGLVTGDNGSYIRKWYEVSSDRIGFEMNRDDARLSGRRWFPISKGGDFRRWYGNLLDIVNWEDDGRELRTRLHPSGGRTLAHNFNLEDIFHQAVTWTKISSGEFSARIQPEGFLFNDASAALFAEDDRAPLGAILALMNSSFSGQILGALNPTLNFLPGSVSQIPWPETLDMELASRTSEEAVNISKRDWDDYECSWGFSQNPMVAAQKVSQSTQLRKIAADISKEHYERSLRQKTVEESNNKLIAEAFGINSSVTTEVPMHRVSIASNVEFRYGRGKAVETYSTLEREDLVSELVSFSIGCMFGRYSLDEPGLILAHQGATVQDYLARVPHTGFVPDADNVLPVVDGDWFEDDVVARFRQFLRAAFGEEHFEENLQFVEESLGVKKLRDYFITRGGKSKFYEDHVKRYKKRPIYWMFSSPKGSFNALIYMHRYNPSTVSTVLNDYLREYEAKLEASLHNLEREANTDGTPRQQAAAAKEAERLRKILVELSEYEHEVMYPLASEQIAIDLDDGVKSNYPKFGSALKKIQGL